MGSPYGPIQHFDGSVGQLGGISGTTGTLPAGLTMGQARWEGGVMYRLFCNASINAQSAGAGFARWVGSALGGNSPYSVTVTTVTESLSGLACACPNTVPTGFYFWGATLGFPVKLNVSNISIATDKAVMPAANGKWTLASGVSEAAAWNAGDQALSTGTTDTASGRFYVDFEYNFRKASLGDPV